MGTGGREEVVSSDFVQPSLPSLRRKSSDRSLVGMFFSSSIYKHPILPPAK